MEPFPLIVDDDGSPDGALALPNVALGVLWALREDFVLVVKKTV